MRINATARSAHKQNEAIVRSQEKNELKTDLLLLPSTYALSLLLDFCSIVSSWYELAR